MFVPRKPLAASARRSGWQGYRIDCAVVRDRFEDIGFYVVAPALEVRSGRTNLETCMNPDSIRMKVEQRIQAYESIDREEASELRGWESAVFAPLLRRLEETNKLCVVSWDQCIEAIGDNHAPTADELRVYYQRCLDLALSKSA